MNSDGYFHNHIGIMKLGKEGEGQMQSLIYKVVNNYRYLYNLAKFTGRDKLDVQKYAQKMIEYDQRKVELKWKDINCERWKDEAAVLNTINFNDEENVEISLWNTWMITEASLRDYDPEGRFKYASLNYIKFDEFGFQTFEPVSLRLLDIFIPIIDEKLTISAATISFSDLLHIFETAGKLETLKLYNWNLLWPSSEIEECIPLLQFETFEFHTNCLKSPDGSEATSA